MYLEKNWSISHGVGQIPIAYMNQQWNQGSIERKSNGRDRRVSVLSCEEVPSSNFIDNPYNRYNRVFKIGFES